MESDLVLEIEEDNIRSATLHSLIQRLTHPSLPDMKIRFVFLLTYRKHTTPHGLLTLLIHRFFVPDMTNMTNAAHAMRSHFHTMIMAPIQIKVLSVIKSWLEDFYDDFQIVLDGMTTTTAESAKSLKTHNNVIPPTSLYYALEQFLIYIRVYATQVTGGWTQQTAVHLLKMLRRKRLERNERGVERTNTSDDQLLAPPLRRHPNTMDASPTSIVPPGGLHQSMFDFSQSGSGLHQEEESINIACLLSPIEVARQCTLIDHDLFCRIKIQECLSKKRTKQEIAPNIWSMIQRFNQLNLWTTTNIVVNSSLEDRTFVYEWTVDFCDALFKLDNFHGAFAVFTGLTSSICERLKLTTANVSTKRKEILESLRNIFKPDGNKQEMRRAMKKANTPAVPHMGIFLSDLTMMDELPSTTQQGQIDFRKCRRISGIIEALLMYQEKQYALMKIPSLFDHLQQLEGTLKRTQSFALSKKYEPTVR